MSTATPTTLSLVADARQREQARAALASADLSMARLEIVTDSQSVALPDDLAHTLTQVVETIAHGGRVVVNSVPNELTTTFAAKILGVSRPTVMKLINEGELPAHKVGTHHRLKLSDVQDFKRSRLLQQREAIDAMMELSDELGQIS